MSHLIPLFNSHNRSTLGTTRAIHKVAGKMPVVVKERIEDTARAADLKGCTRIKEQVQRGGGGHVD